MASLPASPSISLHAIENRCPSPVADQARQLDAAAPPANPPHSRQHRIAACGSAGFDDPAHNSHLSRRLIIVDENWW